MTAKLRLAKPAARVNRVASVPEQEIAKQYISRLIDGLTEFEIFGYARTNGLNVLIEGPTGPGKTMASRAFAAREGLCFYAIPSNVGVEPSQLFGKYIPNEDALDESDPKFIWQDGPVTDIVRHGGVLLINEVNFMPPRIATVMFGLLDGRREITLLDHKGEVIRCHKGQGRCWCTEPDCDAKRVLVVADMNPEYEGTQHLNKAFRNRFPIQLDWDYNPDVEIKLIASSTLRAVAGNIRTEHRNGNIETPVSTNMLMEFESMATDTSLGFAITNFVNHFGRDERAAVRQVFDAVMDNLRSDFMPPAVQVTADADDFDWSDLPGADKAAAEWSFER